MFALLSDPNALLVRANKASEALKKSGVEVAPLTFRIPLNRAQETLKHLAGNGGLSFNGQLMIPDFFSKTGLEYQIEKEGEQFVVRGLVKTTKQEFPLDSCLWFCVSLPLLVLLPGQQLRSLDFFIPDKWLLRLMQAPLKLTREELELFLKECTGDEGLPTVRGNVAELLPQEEITPLLILKDRVGAAAALFLKQGGKRFDLKSPLLPKELKSSAGYWEKDLLETGYQKRQQEQIPYYCPLDKVAKSLSFLLECGWEVEDYRGRQVIRQGELHLQVERDQERVLVRPELSFSNYQPNVQALLGAFNRRESFVELSPNSVGLLNPNGSLQQLAEIALEGEFLGKELSLPLHKAGLLADIKMEVSPDRLLDALRSKTAWKETLPSPQFKGVLRPYQQEGVNWLSFLYENKLGGILADEMGLGKTVQLIAFLSLLPRVEKSPILIVAPRSLLFNWHNELHRFFPDLSVYTHHGAERIKDTKLLAAKHLILTSYGTLREDSTLFAGIENYQTLILDEAQAIKNSSSQTAQAVYLLKSACKVAVTGTPIENNLFELWASFHFALPELLGSYTSFGREVQGSESDSRYLSRIRQKIRPFLLRRTKQQVAPELPEKMEQVVWVELHPEQRQAYEGFLAGARAGLLKKVALEGLAKHRMEALETLLRLRQLCCHPLLVSSLLEEQNTPSSKLELLLDEVETILSEGHKALIYSQFTGMLQLIKQAFKDRQWKFVYLDGQTTNREEPVSQFQNDPETKLFLISLKAGGTGLNLTAADYVLLYDPWWNQAAEAQAIDRAHRMGRTERVIARRYVAVETVEAKIMQLKERKQALVSALLEESDGAALASFTADDLEFLLS